MYLFDEPTRRRKAVPGGIKQELYQAQGGKCMYCGGRSRVDLMDVDHKNPLSKGGSDSRRNFQLLCRTCNVRKGNLTDRQFRTRFSAAGVPQSQTIPSKAIPQSAFDAVANQVAGRKSKQATQRRKQRQNDPFGFFG